MSINIGDKPEVNVVNVGDELTQDQINAITSALNPNADNAFVTFGDIPAPVAQDFLKTGSVTDHGDGFSGITLEIGTDGNWGAFGNITGRYVNTFEGYDYTFASDPSYLRFTNAVYYSYANLSAAQLEFYDPTYTAPVLLNPNGLQFSDGSFQSTAASSSPPLTYLQKNVWQYTTTYLDDNAMGGGTTILSANSVAGYDVLLGDLIAEVGAVNTFTWEVMVEISCQNGQVTNPSVTWYKFNNSSYSDIVNGVSPTSWTNMYLPEHTFADGMTSQVTHVFNFKGVADPQGPSTGLVFPSIYVDWSLDVAIRISYKAIPIA